MQRKDWHGLMKILEVRQVRAGRVVWEAKNLYNTLHTAGEQLLLQILFAGTAIPGHYYVGLDNRSTLSTSDTFGSLVAEPSGGGYVRQSILPNSFTISLGQSAYQATSQIITFSASGATWGPVGNIFLATSSDNSGILVASASLNQTVMVSPGDSVMMRMALSLQDAG